MCGRFTQIRTRADYLEFLASELEFNGALEPVPIGRYNVAPGTRVLLLNQREDTLNLDPLMWGYSPEWWQKMGRAPVINARIETAAESRMFKPLWQQGRALVMADGWYEWKKSPEDPKIKQPWFIYHEDQTPIFFAAISRFHPDEKEPSNNDGFVIVTAASDSGLLDIHDRRPVVLPPAVAREWMDPATSSKRAKEIALEAVTPAEEFDWHPVTKKVGNIRNNCPELIEPLDALFNHSPNNG
ncbi:SOS response-associated peptidase family protein [Serratia sp. (in: enterobacteria)]|uniref:SOS response-associated peptidase family protein n=1 Tax=Serratia sp. (in: enterobacteria) TaxID=616 RepID=UPI00398953EB